MANNKRKKPNESDSDTDPEYDSWPRFLLVSSKNPDQPVDKLSPFAIAKAIKGIAGDAKTVRKLRSGDILVEVDKKSYSCNLLKAEKFVDVPVSVTPHRTLNTKRGVIRCRDLANCDETEIVEELTDQNVTQAKRIHIRKEGQTVPTNTIILTFNTPHLPNSVKVGFLNVRVEVYVPNPLRCFKCQRYGHGKDKCKQKEACARCGEEGHEDQTCTRDVKCMHCGGDHPVYAKKCPKWIQEKEILRIKHVENVSFLEAKTRIGLVNQNVGQTYANVVKPKPKVMSCSTQTDLTWSEKDNDFHTFCHSKPSTSVTVSTSTSQRVSSNVEQDATDPTLTNIQVKNGNTQDLKRPEVSARPRSAQRTDRDRVKKGSDPISVYNRWNSLDSLEDMEAEPPEVKRKQKPHPRSPVKAPDKA